MPEGADHSRRPAGPACTRVGNPLLGRAILIIVVADESIVIIKEIEGRIGAAGVAIEGVISIVDFRKPPDCLVPNNIPKKKLLC